ncbi:MAG: hypothetical protein U0W65_07345 [Bacteroidia bacterium]|nr:hypothetical protein [Bacteroidia bacterium]
MNYISNTIFFTAMSMSVFSCQKDPCLDSEKNYRSNVEGSYYCTVKKTEYIMGSTTNESTYFETVNVSVDYCDANNKSIKINNSTFSSLEAVGNYYTFSDNGSQFKNKYGKFINDSIYYEITNGTNGNSTHYIYTGKK